MAGELCLKVTPQANGTETGRRHVMFIESARSSHFFRKSEILSISLLRR